MIFTFGRRFAGFCAIVATMALTAACAPKAYDRSALREQVAQERGIQQSAIIYDGPVNYASVKSAKICDPMDFNCFHALPFADGVMVVTKQEVRLYRRATGSEALTRDIDAPFDEISSGSVASWGMFKHIHQLQLRRLADTLAIYLLTGDTQDLHAKLLEAGVKSGVPIGRVVLPVGVRTE
jgi:hypothetical protein